MLSLLFFFYSPNVFISRDDMDSHILKQCSSGFSRKSFFSLGELFEVWRLAPFQGHSFIIERCSASHYFRGSVMQMEEVIQTQFRP